MDATGQDGKLNRSEKGSRLAGLDILRCIAMMMVVALHFLGKGELLGDVAASGWDSVDVAAWVLEALCIVAVNVYMLISGYFLSDSSFKLSRLISLYLQVWTYSVGIGVLSVALGTVPAEEVNTHYYLSLLCPISMRHYWFLTAYVFLYLLLPFLCMVVRKMAKGQLSLALTVLLLAFCVLKSVLPFRLEEDGQGYTCLWYICVFLLAAYIRKFGIRFLEKKWHCICLYLGACTASFAEMLILRRIYLNTGSLELIVKVSYEYNHIFVLLASVGLFGLFLKISAENGVGKIVGKVAGMAAPYVLGVYLLHENLGLRYGWQQLFGADEIQTIPQLLFGTAAAAICIFITGVILEWLRSCVMKGLHKLLLHWKGYRWLADSVGHADEIFKKQQS